ncbi:MAG: OmpA family protein, partial [Aeromonas sobria]
MNMSLSLKVILTGLVLTMLAACQSPPKGLTPEQVAVLKEQGFYLSDAGWTLDL